VYSTASDARVHALSKIDRKDRNARTLIRRNVVAKREERWEVCVIYVPEAGTKRVLHLKRRENGNAEGV